MASESPGSVNTLARNNQSKVRTIYTCLGSHGDQQRERATVGSFREPRCTNPIYRRLSTAPWGNLINSLSSPSCEPTQTKNGETRSGSRQDTTGGCLVPWDRKREGLNQHHHMLLPGLRHGACRYAGAVARLESLVLRDK